MIKKFVLALLLLTGLMPRMYSMHYLNNIYARSAIWGLEAVLLGKAISKSLDNAHSIKGTCILGLIGFGTWFAIEKCIDKYNSERSRRRALQLVQEPTLYEACAREDLNLVKDLVNRGADVNKNLTAQAEKPLHVAALNGDLAIVEFLIERGARANAHSYDIEVPTPLHLAVTGHQPNHLEVARLLIKHGADLEASSIQDQTPLHIACKHGNVDMVQFLIDSGADLNVQERHGFTPLVIAAMKSENLTFRTITQMLLAAGADALIENNEGITALHLITSWAPTEYIIDILAHIDEEKIQEAIAKKQHVVNEDGQKEIKSLKDICIADILSRNDTEEIAPIPFELLRNNMKHLSCNQIKFIIATLKNIDGISPHFIRAHARDLFNQCCENQLACIKPRNPVTISYLRQQPMINLFNASDATKEKLVKIVKAQRFDELPIDLQNAVRANIMKALDLQPEDI